ncbi:MAG TPA: hypothetical protein VEX69_08870 [Candidatus Limnocylindria bacterium]|nr:hypothetical protein [Candidatus Limnocylindria bacterium]
MKYFGLAAIAIWILLSLVVAPDAAAQTVNVVVNDASQQTINVSVVFLAANRIKPPTVATPPSESNQTTFTLNLSNVIKTKETVNVQITVRKCENGKEVVYVVQQGATVPPPDERCKEGEKCKCEDRKPVGGYIPVSDGDTITVTITPDAVTAEVKHTAVGGGAAATTPTSHLIWVQLGGNVGFKDFSGVNNCQSVVIIFTGANCKSGTTSFAGGVEGTLGITRWAGIGFGYTRTAEITRTADTPTLTDISKIGVGIETVTGQAFLPLKHVTFSLEGGGAFSQFRETEQQILNSSGTPTTVTTHLHDNVGGPMFGGKIQVPITKYIGAQVHYMWVGAKDKPSLNEHDNIVLFGIVVTLP